jgi:FtsP/CotA-like multicopper oxidase with cupredoxin domain
MSAHFANQRLSRRRLLGLGGGAMAAVGLGLLPTWRGRVLSPTAAAAQATVPPINVTRHLAATDGWIHVPGSVPPYMPDPAAPSGLTNYVFGFRDVTVLDALQNGQSLIQAQKGHVQHSAPLLYFDELDSIQVNLTNLGLQQRPDLVDSHTIHWHGFRNALPLFDGVPEMSIATPIGQTFPYYYHPHDAGTYMYHCHFEDVEHVQMGMQGIVFVRPAQNKTGNGAGAPPARYNGGAAGAPLGYAYNDGVAPGDSLSTAYDREYAMFLGDMWAQAHYNDAHIQATDWSDYHADFWLLNGRSYPDTLAPNGGGIDPATGNLIAPSGRTDLQYQPMSSLVQCNAGDRVLLRVVNLGYTQASMRVDGIPMRVVGKDATPLRGLSTSGTRTGADTSYFTDTVYIGAGESYDAIFTAPTYSGGSGSSGQGYDTYLFFNNALGALTTAGGSGLGGQMTEIRVSPAGALAPQTTPNDLTFHD